MAGFYQAHVGEFLPPLIACVAYLVLYFTRVREVGRRGRPIARWRVVSFVTGVVVLAAVQVGPADTLADDVLAAHMVQHIVIGDLCSLLIVLGLTGAIVAPLLHLRATRPLRKLRTQGLRSSYGRSICTPGTCRSSTSSRSATIWCTRSSTHVCCGSERCCGWP